MGLFKVTKHGSGYGYQVKKKKGKGPTILSDTKEAAKKHAKAFNKKGSRVKKKKKTGYTF